MRMSRWWPWRNYVKDVLDVVVKKLKNPSTTLLDIAKMALYVKSMLMYNESASAVAAAIEIELFRHAWREREKSMQKLKLFLNILDAMLNVVKTGMLNVVKFGEGVDGLALLNTYNDDILLFNERCKELRDTNKLMDRKFIFIFGRASMCEEERKVLKKCETPIQTLKYIIDKDTTFARKEFVERVGELFLTLRASTRVESDRQCVYKDWGLRDALDNYVKNSEDAKKNV